MIMIMIMIIIIVILMIRMILLLLLVSWSVSFAQLEWPYFALLASLVCWHKVHPFDLRQRSL